MNNFKIIPYFYWNSLDTILLDMDGTLLDKYFDDYFWEVHLPRYYSNMNNISIDESLIKLTNLYSDEENSLNWSDIEYWSKKLDINIYEEKIKISNLIAVHPYVYDFLKLCKSMTKNIYLVTNAHPRTLSIKLKNTAISSYFDRIICAEDVGFAKEQPSFWIKLQELLSFDPTRSLLLDDTEKVLRTADKHGVSCLIHAARSSSRKPSNYSAIYPSIDCFSELIVMPRLPKNA